ncbi:MAG TPA: hypothetical protein VLX61_02210 [Anaerolineales bacterium]|nr:hypothetical protein [Anaerolineales bacterium]
MDALKRQPSVDPAVADLLSDLDRRRRLSALPKSARKKARRDAARHKVGMDFPPELHEELRQVADKEKISISSLAAFFAKRGLEEYQAGHVDLYPYKRISRCARFEYILSLEKVDE